MVLNLIARSTGGYGYGFDLRNYGHTAELDTAKLECLVGGLVKDQAHGDIVNMSSIPALPRSVGELVFNALQLVSIH